MARPAQCPNVAWNRLWVFSCRTLREAAWTGTANCIKTLHMPLAETHLTFVHPF